MRLWTVILSDRAEIKTEEVSAPFGPEDALEYIKERLRDKYEDPRVIAAMPGMFKIIILTE